MAHRGLIGRMDDAEHCICVISRAYLTFNLIILRRYLRLSAGHYTGLFDCLSRHHTPSEILKRQVHYDSQVLGSNTASHSEVTGT